MKKILISTYIISICILLFSFTSLLFYKNIEFSIARKAILIGVLIYIFYKSKKHKFKITKDLARLSLMYGIVISFVF